MSPASHPTERLRSLSGHLIYSQKTTTTRTTTSGASGSPSSTTTTTTTHDHSPNNHPTATSNHPHHPTTNTMSDPRPPITCHVLDTTLGRPAPSIPVTLMLLPSTSPPPPSAPNHTSSYSTPFSTPTPIIIATSRTNSDGRVASWDYAPLPDRDDESEKWSISTEKGRVYMLRFETEAYFRECYGEAGGFWPWVDVVFKMGGGDGEGDGREEGERKHYHVPVLLSRFGYSTYRGS